MLGVSPHVALTIESFVPFPGIFAETGVFVVFARETRETVVSRQNLTFRSGCVPGCGTGRTDVNETFQRVLGLFAGLGVPKRPK